MNIKPQISVIIPTYNRGWIIQEAIDSVLSQTCQDFELIVVDDGSTDETDTILCAYGDRIQVIRQKNQGVSAARNSAIKRSSGRYIALLDSDDLWKPSKLDAQLNFFKQNSDAWICQTEEIWVRNGTRVNPKKKHKKPSGMIFDESLHLCLVSPSAVMIHRKLFDEVGLFDESLPACEDYDLWLRVAAKHSVFLIDTPLIIKRGGHEDQLSGMHSLDKYRIKSLLNLIRRDLLTQNQIQKTRDVVIKKCIIYEGGCRKRGKHSEADEYAKIVENLNND